MTSNIILEVKNLKKYFSIKSSFLKKTIGYLNANDGISFVLEKGKTLGIIGESGCGKSTLGRTILKLHEPTSGEIILNGQNIASYTYNQMKPIRRKMQIIFQDPYSSLNPRMTMEQIISEPLFEHNVFKKKDDSYHSYFNKIINSCGLSGYHKNRYAHQFSGGQRQRIGIARVLGLRPSFIVCDEPLSALDVSIRSQIINVFMDFQEKMGISYLFISHDLSVVKHISHNVGVMYSGIMVELSPTTNIYKKPLHPYTKMLLSAVPDITREKRRKKRRIAGEISPTNISVGCRFQLRCINASHKCKTETPIWREIEEKHFVACHKV